MSDTEDDFSKAFEGFGEDPAPATPPATPPVDPPKEDPKPAEEPKKDEEPVKTPEETPPAATDEKKEEEPPKAPETTQPLTKDDVNSVVRDLLDNERSSSKELETTSKEVLDAYYPDGLSNVLTDTNGNELKTPQDVIDASDGQMSMEQATQWLMNEQFKLDKQVDNIKSQAKEIAETTLNFKRDAVSAVKKYEPLFTKYPHLQSKVYEKLMKQVKVDKDKGVILSSPDVMEHYDDYLEPYQQAYEFATKQSATNPTPDPGGEPPKPTAEDRMDVAGDGGQSPVDDPNDFAQQVSKELSKPL